VARLAPSALLLAVVLLLAGCGGDTKTVTETQTEATTSQGAKTTEATGTKAHAASTGHGPRYFETPSHNIGCYVSAHDARCDIRERDWSPPPEPRSCKKIGLDFGQGLVVGPNRAEFVCAGDTTLGGPVTLPYRSSAQRGTILCVSRTAGMTCRNTATGHGFFLSRARYRIF
jgi:hypothetical protein